MLHFLDIFFTVFHSAFTIFNLTGWSFKKTRRAHLICLGLTLGAWVVLGFWYGFGYCPLTDWHWDVKRALGERNLPYSFIEYGLESLLGIDLDPTFVDALTIAGLLFGITMAIYVNFIQPRRSSI